jgi:hypothetical protein
VPSLGSSSNAFRVNTCDIQSLAVVPGCLRRREIARKEPRGQSDVGESAQRFCCGMDPGKFLSHLNRRYSCTIDQFFRLFSKNPLQEVTTRLIVDELKVCHI